MHLIRLWLCLVYSGAKESAHMTQAGCTSGVNASGTPVRALYFANFDTGVNNFAREPLKPKKKICNPQVWEGGARLTYMQKVNRVGHFGRPAF